MGSHDTESLAGYLLFDLSGGMDNEKIEVNPAARIRRKTEGNGRVRFLFDAEGKRLRTAIERRFPEFLPHFLLSIHTGMRMGEQYGLRWNQVDFARRQLHLLRTTNGGPRTIPLNVVALDALKERRERGAGVGAGLPLGADLRVVAGLSSMVFHGS